MNPRLALTQLQSRLRRRFFMRHPLVAVRYAMWGWA